MSWVDEVVGVVALLTPPVEWGVGREVDPEVFTGLSQEQMLSELEALERLTAWLSARSLSLTESLVRAREREDGVGSAVAAEGGAGAALHRAEVHAGLDDEIALATGVAPGVARSRFAMVVGDPERAAPIRRALAAGEVSWARASRIHGKVGVVPVEVVPEIVEKVTAPYPARSIHGVGGLLVPHEIFVDRLSRLVARHSRDEERHRGALADRHVFSVVDPTDGTGEFRVTGHAARVAGAAERVDEIARRLRGEGDARALRQLRSDVALDLLLFGQLTSAEKMSVSSLPGLTPLGVGVGVGLGASVGDVMAAGPSFSGSSFSGALPPARVHVSVSLSSLMGATDEPGTLDCGGRQEWLSAQLVRQMALAAGSTWQRLVTDPATGYLADLSTRAYSVTGHLRDRITARDRITRAPGRTRPARLCDMDHDVDFAAGGPTSESNVSAKDRRSHNHKTRGTWTTHREPGPWGEITWTTHTGRTYATTPWDYRDFDPATPPPEPRLDHDRGATTSPANPEIEIGIQTPTEIEIETQAEAESGYAPEPMAPDRLVVGDDVVSAGRFAGDVRAPDTTVFTPAAAGAVADAGAAESGAGCVRGVGTGMLTRNGLSISEGRVRDLASEFDIDVDEAFTHVAALFGLDPWVPYDSRYEDVPDVRVVRPRRGAAGTEFIPWERGENGPPPF